MSTSRWVALILGVVLIAASALSVWNNLEENPPSETAGASLGP